MPALISSSASLRLFKRIESSSMSPQERLILIARNINKYQISLERNKSKTENFSQQKNEVFRLAFDLYYLQLRLLNEIDVLKGKTYYPFVGADLLPSIFAPLCAHDIRPVPIQDVRMDLSRFLRREHPFIKRNFNLIFDVNDNYTVIYLKATWQWNYRESGQIDRQNEPGQPPIDLYLHQFIESGLYLLHYLRNLPVRGFVVVYEPYKSDLIYFCNLLSQMGFKDYFEETLPEKALAALNQADAIYQARAFKNPLILYHIAQKALILQGYLRVYQKISDEMLTPDYKRAVLET